MTQIDKSKIDELLSAYIDDELSEREQTEVKRLIRNDKDVGEYLTALRKQKELLSAMPVASAPQGMVQDVKAAVERKMILNASPESKTRPDGEKELFTRRLLTTAAMILLPVTILAWVVFSIIMPLSGSGGNTLMTGADPPAPRREINVPAVSFPLNASLDLSTPQMKAVTEFVLKAVYNSDIKLEESPNYEEGRTTCTLRADRRRIVALLRELATVWDEFDSTSLTVHGATMASNTRVENITPEQAVSLYEIGVFSNPMELARSFDRMNRLIESLPGNGFVETVPGQDYVAMDLPMGGGPVMTRVQPKEHPGDSEEVYNATLFITITTP